MVYCKTDTAYVKLHSLHLSYIKYKIHDINVKNKTIQYHYTLFTVASCCHVSPAHIQQSPEHPGVL